MFRGVYRSGAEVLGVAELEAGNQNAMLGSTRCRSEPAAGASEE
jgi:hypothetical protein